MIVGEHPDNPRDDVTTRIAGCFPPRSRWELLGMVAKQGDREWWVAGKVIGNLAANVLHIGSVQARRENSR